MIRKIAHLGDIHIPKSPNRHEEYREVFNRLYESLRNKNIDRIVIVGDLFHDFIETQPEANILAGEFLNKLSEIAPVRLTRGNHDIRKKSLKRIDSIEGVVTLINNPNVIYYNETGFFDDDNVAWAVWKHGEKYNNPWSTKKKNYPDKKITIDLFHDPVNGAKTPTGFEIKKKNHYSLKDFKGNYSFFGDIHKLQIFNNNAGYCGSLISQNFAEGDYEFHGYIVWDIIDSKIEYEEIHNDYTFKTANVNPYTDFDELSINIDNPTKYMKVRVIWKTHPQTFNEENKRNVLKHIKDIYSPIQIFHKTQFIEDDEIIIDGDVDTTNITDQNVQHEIFKEYFVKIGVTDEQAESILILDDEISSRIEKEEFTNIEWSILKMSCENFMSYKNLDIDWRDMDGLYQITGLNTAGKTTILKLITYILFNKTLETEKIVKFGDMRYINNRLNVNHCVGTIVIEVNGEFFGIKRSTSIEKTKNHEIKGAPTTLEYYKFESPDDEFTIDNSFENLNDEQRNKTQKVLEKAIGTYDNFMRVVMTTSDTLNKILSNDMAIFVDSLLHDSGLDIFDVKLEMFKDYNKELSSKPKITCNVERSLEIISTLESENENTKELILSFENKKLPDVDSRIVKGEKYVESIIKKLNKIDEEIYDLNVEETKKQINIHDENIRILLEKENRITESISKLKEIYDENRLELLLKEKESHKDKEYKNKILITKHEREVLIQENNIQKINGDVSVMKKNGAKLKDEIIALKKSKTCPTCGQLITEDHQKHLDDLIKKTDVEMYNIVEQIKIKNNGIPEIKKTLNNLNAEILLIKNRIKENSLNMDSILHEIGEITNDKNDVEKRREILIELDKIPIQSQNQELIKGSLTKLLELHDKNLKQINENQKIEAGIVLAKERLSQLNQDKESIKDQIYRLNMLRGQNMTKIKEINDNVVVFKEQEKQDEILSIYKKCIHRDGIPTQLLKTHTIPKINKELNDLLEDVNFKVWLDENDLKPKLAYNGRLDAIIDAISSSGKERTFASVALKFALNQINSKSKPKMMLLDEICGKLIEESVEEFSVLLTKMKEKVEKILIIEHNHQFNIDYVINVVKEDDISSLTIE